MSIISHVSVGTTRDKFAQMVDCYDAVMLELGAKRKMMINSEGSHVPVTASITDNIVAVAYGKYYPEFWVQLPHDTAKNASAGNGVHVAFNCRSADQVQRAYEAAIQHGAQDNGPPGPRPEYSDKYYGAFFVDPFGNKVEVVFFDMGIIMNNCVIL